MNKRPSVKTQIFEALKAKPMDKHTCDSFFPVRAYIASTTLSTLYKDGLIKRSPIYSGKSVRYEYWYDPLMLSKQHVNEINGEHDKLKRRALQLQHEIEVRIQELERVLNKL